MNTKSIAIVGGGAAGFFAAINAAQLAKKQGLPLEIKIFEASGRFLKKVKISGGGRCNVTHNCFDVKTFCQNYPRGSRELLSPMQKFQAKDTVEWFKKAGVQLVAEVDGRMFPKTNSSDTIVNCYTGLAKKYGIEMLTHHSVSNLQVNSSQQFELEIPDKDNYCADALLIATGSSPAGYRLAESLGHSISERAPSLFSFKIKDPLIADLQGLSFPEAELKLTLPEKKTFKQQGPLLITHWGLSGPAILKLSAWAAREMKRSNYKGILTVNWMGSEKQFATEKRLQKIKMESPKSFVKNIYLNDLPSRFWLNLLNKHSIPHDKQWANLSKKDFSKISQELTASQLTIQGQNRFKDEFVECGGIDLPEVSFKTMESKHCPNLYFAGEILDIDGITGGFNFQNAWTTGWLAAQSMVNKLLIS